MKEYESIFIVNQNRDENSINKVVNDIQSFIKSNGYNLKKTELWGRKKLAYEVKGCDDGFFVFMSFESEPNFIAQLSRFYQLSEDVIKYLTVSPRSETKSLSLSDQRINAKEDEDDIGVGIYEEDDEDQ